MTPIPPKTITVVLEVADPRVIDFLYEALEKGSPIFMNGLIPRQIRWCDQVTIPNQITDIVRSWPDQDQPSREEYDEVKRLADKFFDKVLPPLKPLSELINDARGGLPPPSPMQGFA